MFLNLKVIIFDELEFVVLKGVVIYGKFKRIVEMWICKYIYGVVFNRYVCEDDLDNKFKCIMGKYYICIDVFEKFISIGD